MTRDAFDFVPQGFQRSGAKGWLKPVPNPQARTVRALAEENARLQAALDAMNARLAKLEESNKG